MHADRTLDTLREGLSKFLGYADTANDKTDTRSQMCQLACYVAHRGDRTSDPATNYRVMQAKPQHQAHRIQCIQFTLRQISVPVKIDDDRSHTPARKREKCGPNSHCKNTVPPLQ